ncbi:MAG: glycosyltransferase [Acidimicrobiales bacterium]
MSVAIVAPMAVPVTWGGAERAVDGLRAAIEAHTAHRAEVVKLPVDESNLVGIVAGYRDFSRLDLSAHERVVSVKYPAWIVSHPRHTLLMFHPLRGLYDTYHLFGLPLHPSPQTREVADLRAFMGGWGERAALAEFFERFDAVVRAVGRDHPDLAFPGPFAREVVPWLDHVALNPGEVERYAALSRTVARRPGYFPPGVHPRVVHLPGDLDPAPTRTAPGHSFFTASRLDGAKRLDLVIDAMAHVPGDVALRIAGTGPLADELRSRAAHDPRISFCGFVPDESLSVMYREAIAVPFVPDDEDLGLVALEAFSQGTPVVTCTDSGGPTEFVADGVTGLVAPPTAAGVGRALARLAADRAWAADLGREAQRRGARVTWARAVADLLGDDLPRHAASFPAAAPTPAPHGARRPRVAVLATFTVDAPRHGGELRARNLYGALAHDADVHVVSLVGRGWAPSSGPVAPGLTQTVVPRSRAHSDLDDEVSLEARMPVTDILAGPHRRTPPPTGPRWSGPPPRPTS